MCPIDLSTYRPIDLSTYRPIDLSSYRPIVLSSYRPIDLSSYRPIVLSSYRPIDLSSYRPIVLSTYRPIDLSSYRPIVLSSYRAAVHSPLRCFASTPVDFPHHGKGATNSHEPFFLRGKGAFARIEMFGIPIALRVSHLLPDRHPTRSTQTSSLSLMPMAAILRLPSAFSIYRSAFDHTVLRPYLRSVPVRYNRGLCRTDVSHLHVKGSVHATRTETESD